MLHNKIIKMKKSNYNVDDLFNKNLVVVYYFFFVVNKEEDILY